MIEEDFKAIAAQQSRTELAAPEDLASVRKDWENLKNAPPESDVLAELCHALLCANEFTTLE